MSMDTEWGYYPDTRKTDRARMLGHTVETAAGVKSATVKHTAHKHKYRRLLKSQERARWRSEVFDY